MKNIGMTFIIVISATCIVSTAFGEDHSGDSHPQTETMPVQMHGGMMNRDGMREMMQQMMPDMLPPGISPEDLPDPDSAGAKLVARYCGQCHNLPSPAMHSAQEWPRIADRMFYRMSMMSGGRGMMMNVESPTPGEQRAIIAYLQKHAMTSIPPDTIPSPGTAGAALFKKTCSQCHALPDPKAHTAREWPQIVERMQSHLRSMNRTAMSENEKKDIINYLMRNARR